MPRRRPPVTSDEASDDGRGAGRHPKSPPPVCSFAHILAGASYDIRQLMPPHERIQRRRHRHHLLQQPHHSVSALAARFPLQVLPAADPRGHVRLRHAVARPDVNRQTRIQLLHRRVVPLEEGPHTRRGRRLRVVDESQFVERYRKSRHPRHEVERCDRLTRREAAAVDRGVPCLQLRPRCRLERSGRLATLALRTILRSDDHASRLPCAIDPCRPTATTAATPRTVETTCGALTAGRWLFCAGRSRSGARGTISSHNPCGTGNDWPGARLCAALSRPYRLRARDTFGDGVRCGGRLPRPACPPRRPARHGDSAGHGTRPQKGMTHLLPHRWIAPTIRHPMVSSATRPTTLLRPPPTSLRPSPASSPTPPLRAPCRAARCCAGGWRGAVRARGAAGMRPGGRRGGDAADADGRRLWRAGDGPLGAISAAAVGGATISPAGAAAGGRPRGGASPGPVAIRFRARTGGEARRNDREGVGPGDVCAAVTLPVAGAFGGVSLR
eukprot:ctg_3149.g577